ncbi:MAG: TIGR00300 family protein [Gemmatimonadetes bacterium]|nr:TIGR00300 family protein [Gemmatimonadota bacterium]
MANTAKVRAEGHLIDSGTLSHIFEHITRAGASYETLRFDIGHSAEDMSTAILEVTAASDAALEELLADLVPLGAVAMDHGELRLEPAEKDGVVHDDFYSTTNHRTEVRVNGKWIPVEKQRMDSMIVVRDGRAVCTKLRSIKKGDPVVVGSDGIRVYPVGSTKEHAESDFGFMTNEVSSERVVGLVVDRIAKDVHKARREGTKVIVVAGPVVVHTGGVDPFVQLIRGGFVDAVLAGNALAVHDIERALYNTSLGIDATTGDGAPDGPRHHMRAINAIRRSGSIPEAVTDGTLKSGVMHALVESEVPFVLAGSLRDDGPLPEVITDMNEAQEAYSGYLQDASVVLILSTMLHGIAVGNMLASSALTVCVDINPAVVTKLADRGTAQAVGVVTDVGLFLSLLASRLGATASA